jgi:hypothetical protein
MAAWREARNQPFMGERDEAQGELRRREPLSDKRYGGLDGFKAATSAWTAACSVF